MSKVEYSRTLTEVEYSNLFQVLSVVTGDESIRLVASTVSEKIGKEVSENLTKTSVQDTSVDGKVTTKVIDKPPTKITISLSRLELDNIHGAFKSLIKKEDTKVETIMVLKSLSKCLGMFTRFSKYVESVISTTVAEPEGLDEEIELVPLDDEL